ncbi:unnamed protein product [Phyllotreta striolata]|uniref:Uncharacterized protein n=1 Tax=Phyllotreta striolata TaxID=444603 RepID=A0A9N9TL04_PHYSR|nr:unnamed protein product [Phyllotreta striolata]
MQQEEPPGADHGRNECSEYQVDCVSIGSCEDSDEGDDSIEEYVKSNNAIVVDDKPHVPYFGSVSVVNSNEVHFGNKTVYKGPVTIKQIVCPNGISESTKNGSIKAEENGNGEVKERKIEADNVVNNTINKGFISIEFLQHKKLKLTILFVVITIISIATVTAVVVSRGPSKILDQIVVNNGDDDISPINYSSDSKDLLGDLRLVKRLLWLAQPASAPLNRLKLPVSLVIIHHTATESCQSQAKCVFITRYIQTFHMESNGWSDIGYNFLIGGDGSVYEGRGWQFEGAHTLHWNKASIGVAFIGTFNGAVPADNMMVACRKLIEKGVKDGYLTKDYQIMAARQFYGTESPGKVFYEHIKANWTRWTDLKGLKIDKSAIE